MLEVSQDTHSLSSSKRNILQLLQQLKETGEPVVITINGKTELIVQDATSYQQLMAYFPLPLKGGFGRAR